MRIDVVIRLRGGEAVAAQARELLAVLHARPGFLGGRVGQSVEDDGGVAVLAQFADLGSWRRALGATDVKLLATPLLGAHAESVSTYETADEAGPGPEPVRRRP
ncbi:MAG TPA: antibiotic biosynthesis monooxygenase [Mycobacteriales bacterium]|nr:antibiotic biosynthesis monooxygenase [Mycobacteriales bacterium]